MITCIAIDDDPLFLQIIRSYIEEIDNVTLMATYENPVDGIMEVVKKKPDVMLIDWDMPYLDGFETLESLDKKPKIIMISANVDLPVKRKRVHINGYLRKVNFSKEILESAIHKVLGR